MACSTVEITFLIAFHAVVMTVWIAVRMVVITVLTVFYAVVRNI